LKGDSAVRGLAYKGFGAPCRAWMREFFGGRLIEAPITEKNRKTRTAVCRSAKGPARNTLKTNINWNAACLKCASSPAST
jgi:hypothetical protein